MDTNPKEKNKFYPLGRFRRGTVWLVLFLFSCALIGRLVWIQILYPDTLIKEGNARIVRNYHFEPARGLITDRFGKILAISVPVKTVDADPKLMHESGIVRDDTVMTEIAKILEIDKTELYEKVKDPNRRFVHLKHYLDPKEASKLKKLCKDSLILHDSYRRYYPTGEVNAGLVGILNGEGDGVYGVEQSFNSYLSAQQTTRVAHKDSYNNIIENLATVQEGNAGGNLMLSVDDRLQSIAYAALGQAVREHRADSGSAVLIDVQTGEIVSLVNYPSFDPNNRKEFDSSNAKNRAITDIFEPGSTMKPLVALAGLESRMVSWGEIFDTRPFVVDGKVVRDSHFMDRGNLTDIIKYSSNTGMARISMRIGPNRVMDMLQRFGFGRKTQSGLIGESAGRLNENRKFWAEIDKATLGFGYGVAVTNLQLTSAYATLAHGGEQLPVSILKLRDAPQSEQVVSQSEDRRMIAAMESVVSEGTGKKAAINRYRVAGKTGTAKIAQSGTYSDLYMATFAGFAPISKPRFAMVVVIEAPREGGFYGGSVSGPVFSEVMASALQLYNVPPDRPEEENR
ncbi:MAG: peptidoglycan glycosyltransferase FtsI [Succinivibrio sp.]|nr:peptidoglycan glycosyltransferase FtsI [Succinivibrio sp.]